MTITQSCYEILLTTRRLLCHVETAALFRAQIFQPDRPDSFLQRRRSRLVRALVPFPRRGRRDPGCPAAQVGRFPPQAGASPDQQNIRVELEAGFQRETRRAGVELGRLR